MNQTFDVVVILHGACQDGTAAGWVVRKYLNEISPTKIRFVFGMHRDIDKDLNASALTVNDLEGKDVWILDYMYPAESIQRIKYRSLTIIDHHIGNKDYCIDCSHLENTRVFFNVEQSASGLAWRTLFPSIEVPWWIQYIEERDLFKYTLPYSREISNAMYTLKYRSFAKFDELHTFTEQQKQEFANQGILISTVKQDIVSSIVRNAHHCTFDTYKIYVVETSVLVSDVSEALYLKYKDTCDFVMCIYYDFKGRYFKCRLRNSNDSLIDLSTLADRYRSRDLPGGGHEHAASFSYRGDVFSLLENRDIQDI